MCKSLKALLIIKFALEMQDLTLIFALHESLRIHTVAHFLLQYTQSRKRYPLGS